jgi:aryl-alcohol dehydrogenase-like predicted oxidoreductase
VKLERLAFISVVTGRGFVCNPKLRWPAIRSAIGTHAMEDLCAAYAELVPMRQTWNSMEPRSYRAGMARLRMGLCAATAAADPVGAGLLPGQLRSGAAASDRRYSSAARSKRA